MSLPQAGHEHHERIREQIDRLPALIDMLELRPPPAEVGAAFLSSYEFITGTLWPHVRVVEDSVYPELERLMQNRHSMAPMRREHDELGRLIEAIGAYVDRVEAGPLRPADAMGLRRLVIQLYALVKTHIAEEAEYLRVLQGNLSAEEQEAIVAGLAHASAA
jgi:iron-sulfur cluster repair protein YtfE (RIC family)